MQYLSRSPPPSLIRLEFNSEECEYYTELDGVALRGHKPKRESVDHAASLVPRPINPLYPDVQAQLI